MMKGSSDSEDESESPHGEKEPADQGCNPKAEREEKLRQMMEDNGDFMPVCDTARKSDFLVDNQSEEEPSMSIDKQEEPEGPEIEEPVISRSNGRRRGKRRVMKKKTMKDAEGYLSELLCPCSQLILPYERG